MNKYTSQKNLNVGKSTFNIGRQTMSPNLKFNYCISPSSHTIQLAKPSIKNIQYFTSAHQTNINFQSTPLRRLKNQNIDSKEQVYNLTVTLLIQFQQLKDSFIFSYNSLSLVRDFLDFVKKRLSRLLNLNENDLKNKIYYKTGNMHFDYFLTLPHRYMKEIPFDKTIIKVCRLNSQILYNRGSLKMFEIIKCIGSGGFSKVFLARAYGIMMAIKIIEKDLIVKHGKQFIVENQKHILESCSDHPFVTKLFLSLETDKYVIFGMEYCNGGELFNLLRRVKKMKENQAKFYFLETLSVIGYLHSKNILYRDLKPQNIIIDSYGHIRLADYGLSKVMTENRTYSFCGSAQYMAPEMLLKKGHGFQVDYYCIGALLYELVTGLPPYYSRDQNQLFENILTKNLVFPDESNCPLSTELKIFLTKLLSKQQNQRFNSIEEMFTYDWLKNVSLKDVIDKKMIPPFTTEMFTYNFDDEEFVMEQEQQMRKLQIQKDNGSLKHSILLNFQFQCEQIQRIVKEREKSLEMRKIKDKNDRASKQLMQINNKKLENFKRQKDYLATASISQQINLAKQFKIQNNNILKKQVSSIGNSNVATSPTSPKNYDSLLNNVKSMGQLHPYYQISPRNNNQQSAINHVKNTNYIYTSKKPFLPFNFRKSPQPIELVQSFSHINNNIQPNKIDSNRNFISIIPSITTKTSTVIKAQGEKSLSKQKSFSQKGKSSKKLNQKKYPKNDLYKNQMKSKSPPPSMNNYLQNFRDKVKLHRFVKKSSKIQQNPQPQLNYSYKNRIQFYQ